MGVVHEAVDVRLGRRVALKRILRDVEDPAGLKRRLQREAIAAGRVQHPNVLATTEVVDDPEHGLAIVMELAAGESLGELLGGGRTLAPAHAVAIATQVLAGLAAAHAAGVVHRDLKPSNVLLVKTGDGRVLVKLADFGVAKVLDAQLEPLTCTGLVLGTIGYLAPEQATGAKDVDARCDVYAAGALLYRMLSGRLPHQRDGAAAMLLATLTDPVPPLSQIAPHVPVELASVIERALQKVPDDRFASAEEMLRALAPFAADDLVCQAIPTTRIGFDYATPRPRARRRSTWAARIAIVCLAFGLVLGGNAEVDPIAKAQATPIEVREAEHASANVASAAPESTKEAPRAASRARVRVVGTSSVAREAASATLERTQRRIAACGGPGDLVRATVDLRRDEDETMHAEGTTVFVVRGSPSRRCVERALSELELPASPDSTSTHGSVTALYTIR